MGDVSNWVLWVTPVLCACSFQPQQAGGDGGGDRDDAPPPARCDPPPAFDTGLTPTTTIFVAPTTSGTPDGSMARPFTSLNAALANRQPGTRIVVQGGSYPGETILDLHGTAAAPFWIEGPTSAPRATFTSSVRFATPQYVVLRHLDFRPATGLALVLDDANVRAPGTAHHLALEDLDATSSSSSNCVVLTGLEDVHADGIVTSGCVAGVRIVGTSRAVLSRLRISGTSLAAITVSGGSADVEIRQSVITDPGMRGIWLGGTSSEDEFRPPLTAPAGNAEASNVRVLNSVVIGDTGDAIACSQCRDVLVAGNLIMGTWPRIGRLIDEHGAIGGFDFLPSGDMQWTNNAIDVSAMATAFDADSNTEPASVTFSHNLWNNTTAPPAGDPAAILGMPSGYDMTGRLCAGPAVRAGVAIPELAGTLDGACRADPPSIGPDEPGPDC
jgi:hypothetical protein